MRNGLKIQWGSYIHDNIQKEITQRFDITYSSPTSYAIFTTNKLSTNPNSPCDYSYTSSFVAKNVNSFTRKMTTNNRLAGFDWFATGY